MGHAVGVRPLLLALVMAPTTVLFLNACSLPRTDARAPAAKTSLIADSVCFGDAASEAAHAVHVTGHAEATLLNTEIGAFHRTSPTRTVTGKGSRVTATLRRPARTDALILEMQELHDRRPQAFGYTIEVNGVGVYFRTFEEVGGGPVHYFVRIPADVAARSDTLTVSWVSAGGAPFSLGRLWLYEDFFGTIDTQEQVYRPMALMGDPVITPDLGGPGRDFAPFGEYRCINFLNTPRDAAREDIRRSLRLSGETGRPLQLLFNGTTWGGAPSGPDGQGGYFTDIRYSQLAYDQPTHTWSASYPNMWNSFWTTSHEPHLKQVMHQRFVAALGTLATDVDFLKARGMPPSVVYGREYGPPLGEITATTMAIAAKDGVTLDPSDGLDARERRWLHTHDVQLWQEFATWHAEVFPRDSVVVDRGAVRLPTTQAMDDQYAHTVFVTDLGPMRSRRWFGGQVGMVDGFWSSGEVFFERYELYDYVRANGKLGHINIWAPFANQPRLIRSLYDSGFQFATFIGASEPARKALREADACADLPALLPPHHLPALLEVFHHAQRTLGPAERVLSVHNLRIHQQSRECADVSGTARLAVDHLEQPGDITYRLDRGGEPLTALALQVDGRIAPGKENRIEVWLGTTEASLSKITDITADQLPSPQRWEPFMTSKATIPLGDSLAGATTGVIRLVFHAAGAADAAFLLETKITGQWPQATGHRAGNPFTMRQQRTLNMWVQDRVVAERLVERYRRLAGDDATWIAASTLLNEGRYRSVQTLLNGALSEVLPARYAIHGHGRLGRFPVTVHLPSDDDALVLTLHRMTEDVCEFSTVSDVERQAFTVDVDAQDGSRWSLVRDGDHYRATRDAAGTMTATHGVVQFAGEAHPVVTPRPSMPATVVARYLDGNQQHVRCDTQQLDLMRGEESMDLPVANGAIVQRLPDRLTKPGAATEWPSKYDRMDLDLNAQGQITAIRARYGYDHGRLKTITPFSPLPPYSNGTITLENGQTYEFDTATMVDTYALHGNARAYEDPMLTAALRPGMELDLDYAPAATPGTTPRLLAIRQAHHELWSQDFTAMKADAPWRAATVSAEGLVVAKHDAEPFGMASPENPIVLMRPAMPFAPGTVVYRITSPTPLTATALEFSARVYEDSSSIAFEVSTDDAATWTPCGRFDSTWQNCYAQGVIGWKIPWNFIDLSRQVAGKTSFLIRLTLRVSASDDRMALGRLRVMTEGAPQAAP